jgi:rRNA-processing protein FCF1
MEEFELPSFLVVPDTNVLYSKKPEYIVSQKFMGLWSEMRVITSLQLLVPEAVQEELIFQKVFIGQQARENATKSLSTIASVTAKQRTGLPTDKTLRADVAKTFTAWAKDNNAIVVKTPIGKIDWPHVVKNSLHRLPPFSRPSAVGDDTEKGFRDALILETLKRIWVEHPDKNIASSATIPCCTTPQEL